ncbi:FHF complex subunit HOOK interacting protein 1B isoform X5 [Panthera pardus]|uniref:FHF complex subunit HOOK-interacting protein 1B n=1 Tax=Panthera pardus TaxID=9691 RepID=A0A9V1FYH5_PANPR|nr:FHF complex subunit HOOK interacting protein 1B isoform X4 [Felis catus]XP_007083205.2 FHF complex subunit HOOK interacting protein 1B isoform X4 [Panthera tigris]XP_019311632.1 FHF complex subunit HOOK interacting protein 1B isoform X5 [Panthera pardus]XP_042760353.1 FHF complex subunit HOOK interacting protein 1B isoform X4 [Panthera leo]XP_043436424.1 FHF complex subunit HOOK interacting protein 1B isoform X4 [Prionailurus bengalensis]XP_060461820.1 FHF complex subunit HOOK-interacting p
MERMNWLSRLASRGPGHRVPQGSSLQAPVMADPETCLMVFKNHWSQVVRILERQGPRAAPGGADDLSAVRNHTYQMLTLLVEDRVVPSAPTTPGPLLEFALREDLLTRVLVWQLQWDELGDGVEERRAEQLKLFEMLVSEARQPLLRHGPVREALLTLLDACGRPVPSSPALDEGLVLLLSQLCVCLAREPSLLEFFLQPPPEPGAAPRLLLFSRLVPFVHREGTLGQQARDALLLLMALSAGSPTVGRYIADHSYFCPVLATGLSALYSSLPRKIEVPGDDWHCLRREDWLGVPALALFMSSLEFCNAVIQVAHPLVQKQLVDYIHNGFLVPVMGPALHKTSVEEMIASTAYLELFLRSISEPALLRTFLRFLLLHRHDTHTILDTLVARIGSNSRLCMVSLSLFRTLLNLSCEDVLLQLVLRYLVPCNHVMLSQKPAVRDVDLYGRAADKFLSLIPRCCRHRAPSPPRPEHASWARGGPSREAGRREDTTGPGSPSVDSSSVVTVPRPSTPSRLALFLRQQSLGGSESPAPAPRSPGLAASPASSPGRRPSPVEEPGPFMAVLFAKLENMLQNSVYVNFLLTGLVAQLACHPQPLLRSFLLNTNMVFQPSVKSLLQVLGSVKNKIESFAASQEDFPALLSKAKKYLIARGKLDWAEGPAAGPTPRRSDPLVKSRRPSLGELLLRHAHSPTRARQAAQLVLQPGRDGAGLGLGGGSPGASTPVLPPRGGAPERQGEALRVKNAVYCAVIFPEFLKELAAISQAHAVTSPFLLDTSEEGSGPPVSGFGPLNP